MTHRPSLAGSAAARTPDESGACVRVRVRARILPPQLASARDALFEDADQHGPRAGALAFRTVPTFVFLVAALAVACASEWRGRVIDLATPAVADLLLVVPVLVALVLFAAALAPLARVRIEPLLGGGLMLLALGGWLVHGGAIVVATVPSTVGALLLGLAASRMVRRAVWALPLLLAAGVSDAHSVAYGVTDRLLDGTQDASVERVAATTAIAPDLVQRIDLLVLHVPVATGVWLLGLVDIVAIGLLLGLAHLFWRPLGVTAVALVAALVGAVASGTIVPVLPLLGLAWIVANAPLVWRSTRFSLRRLLYLGG